MSKPDNTAVKRHTLPSHFLFQWHVTERCNLRCTHCYQNAVPPPDLPPEKLQALLQQFIDFLALARRDRSAPVKAQITITGGEPFVRPDFMDLLHRIAERKDLWSFAILTNGTLIDRKLAGELAALKPAFVQVSIEGTERTHDSIRGTGSFRLAVQGLKNLVRHKVPAIISFTANRENIHDFPKVAKLARSLNVTRLWADRMIPIGGSAPNLQRVLSPDETRVFFETMAREQKRWSLARTEIAMQRALQFIAGGGRPYRCAAGHSLLTILPDGSLVPCRRMPTPSGNLFDEPLSRLYFTSPPLQRLQDRQRVPKGCEKCFYSDVCNGGLKCLSSAIHHDPFIADPGCWLSRDPAASLPKNDRMLSNDCTGCTAPGCLQPSHQKRSR